MRALTLGRERFWEMAAGVEPDRRVDGRRRAMANGLAGALEGLGEAGVAIGGRDRVGE